MPTPRVLALSLAWILVLSTLPAFAGEDGAAPSPKPGAVISGSAEALTLFVDDAPLRDVLGAIAKVANLNLLVSQDVEGTITARFHDLPPRRALEELARLTGHRVVEEENGVWRFFRPRKNLAPPPNVPPLELQLRFYDARDLLDEWPTLVADVREAFPNAQIEFRNDLLIVTATPGVQEDVEAWLLGVRRRQASRDGPASRNRPAGRAAPPRSPFAVPPRPPMPQPAGDLHEEIRRLTREVRQLRRDLRALRGLLESQHFAEKRRPPDGPVEADR